VAVLRPLPATGVQGLTATDGGEGEGEDGAQRGAGREAAGGSLVIVKRWGKSAPAGGAGETGASPSPLPPRTAQMGFDPAEVGPPVGFERFVSAASVFRWGVAVVVALLGRGGLGGRE
jgi:hypothetical protein